MKLEYKADPTLSTSLQPQTHPASIKQYTHPTPELQLEDKLEDNLSLNKQKQVVAIAEDLHVKFLSLLALIDRNNNPPPLYYLLDSFS